MRRTSPSTKPPGSYTKLGVSLLITLALVVPLAMVGVRVAMRHAKLDTLGSTDPAIRERGLNWLIRETPDDPTLIGDVADLLDQLPDQSVVEVRNALGHAGTADHPAFREALLDQLDRVSVEALRGIAWTLPVDDPEVRGRVIAATLPRLDDMDRTSEQHESVVALLDHFRGWSSPPVPVGHYVAWIIRGLDAERSALRVRVAQQLGDLPITRPDVPVSLVEPPLLALLGDSESEVRHAALVALAGYVPQHPALLSAIERQRDDPAPGAPGVAAFAARLIEVWHGRHVAADAARNGDPSNGTNAGDDWSHVLIDLEARGVASVDLAFDPAMPHLVRVMATRAARDARPAWLLDTLRLNGRPAVRDLACVVAAERFAPAELLPLIRQLLADHDPDGRVSAAVISGLTGVGTSELRAAAERETDAATRHLLRVGLWMQQALPALDGRVAAMLGRTGLPDSTLMLALLRRGDRRAALDHLLARDDAGLIVLLRNNRWAHVLTAFLPPDAPRPLPGADPAVFVEQLADLRAWHALHRHRTDPPVTGR